MTETRQRRPRRREVLFMLCLLSTLNTAAAQAAPNTSSSSSSAALDKRAVDRAPLVVDNKVYLCRPLGECSPCQHAHMKEPSCELWGNRRQLSCDAIGHASSSADLLRNDGKHIEEQGDSDIMRSKRKRRRRRSGDGGSENDDQAQRPREGGHASHHAAAQLSTTTANNNEPVLVWEACERVVNKERRDFFEFALCNFGFAIASLTVLVMRHRKLAIKQYGRLAARIGISVV